jgi:hypothetical protein
LSRHSRFFVTGTSLVRGGLGEGFEDEGGLLWLLGGAADRLLS